MSILVCDIDGTVADSSVRSSRIQKAFPTPEDVAVFTSEESMAQDVPFKGALEFFCNLKKAVYPIFDTLMFLTGRCETQREVTVNWLTQKLGLNPHDYLLCMRPKQMTLVDNHQYKEMVIKDMIQAPEFKNEKFIFIDDDLQCCKVLSKYGLALRAPGAWYYLNHDLS